MSRPDLGKSLNTDEAIALGAVYQGAGHSKLFRVKKFIVKEGAVFPIQVCLMCVYYLTYRCAFMHCMSWFGSNVDCYQFLYTS